MFRQFVQVSLLFLQTGHSFRSLWHFLHLNPATTTHPSRHESNYVRDTSLEPGFLRSCQEVVAELKSAASHHGKMARGSHLGPLTRQHRPPPGSCRAVPAQGVDELVNAIMLVTDIVTDQTTNPADEIMRVCFASADGSPRSPDWPVEAETVAGRTP